MFGTGKKTVYTVEFDGPDSNDIRYDKRAMSIVFQYQCKRSWSSASVVLHFKHDTNRIVLPRPSNLAENEESRSGAKG